MTKRWILVALMAVGATLLLAEPSAAQTLEAALSPVTDILIEAVDIGTNIYFRLIASLAIIVGVIVFAIWKGRRGSGQVIFAIVAIIVYNVGITVLDAVLP